MRIFIAKRADLFHCGCEVLNGFADAPEIQPNVLKALNCQLHLSRKLLKKMFALMSFTFLEEEILMEENIRKLRKPIVDEVVWSRKKEDRKGVTGTY